MQPARRMAEERIFVRTESACHKAIKSKGLERSFKQAIPKEVYESLEKEMEHLESTVKHCQ